VGVLGGAGRTLDVGEAFAIVAGGALGAGGGASPNSAADAGPPTRAKTAIREIRTNMEKRNSGKEMLAGIYPAGESKSMWPQLRAQQASRVSLSGHDATISFCRNRDLRLPGGPSFDFSGVVLIATSKSPAIPLPFPLTCARSQE
jgi:hypothetical protein